MYSEREPMVELMSSDFVGYYRIVREMANYKLLQAP
jgi:hypothetical protein